MGAHRRREKQLFHDDEALTLPPSARIVNGVGFTSAGASPAETERNFMKTLKSYICGRWHEASSGFAALVNPSTEEEIARASSQGIDFGEVLAYAREKGGPALRGMTFAQRSGLLKEMSRVLRDHRDELLDLSRQNNGSTAPDGSFDLDGATGTLAFYSSVGKRLGDRTFLTEGEGVQLAKTEAF